MTDMRRWFDGRSLRERRMILVMLGLLVVTVIWGGVIRPIRDALSSARERHADAVVRLAVTQAEVAAVRAAGRRPPLTGTLADTVRTRAESAGFLLQSLDEPGAGRVRVTIQAAKPGALGRWLAQLETAGVLVESAGWRNNGDGSVAADLVLRARSS